MMKKTRTLTENSEIIRKLNLDKLSFGGMRSYESAIREVKPLALPERVKNGSSPIVVRLLTVG